MANSARHCLKSVALALGLSCALSHVAPLRAADGLSDSEFETLRASEGFAAMRKPRSLNFASDEIARLAEAAKESRAKLVVQEIDPSHDYEVVIQVGHFPRVSGSTGAQGKLITEQEGAAYVAALLVEKLEQLGIDHIVIGADGYKAGAKRDGTHFFGTKIFLSLHLDGSERPCRVGPSLGYNPKFGKESMQLIGVAVAIGLSLNARDFMRDNYTSNLSHFYSYRHSDSEIAEGIIELSELSCPPSEEQFLASANTLAANIATALTFMLGERR